LRFWSKVGGATDIWLGYAWVLELVIFAGEGVITRTFWKEDAEYEAGSKHLGWEATVGRAVALVRERARS